MTYYAVCRNCGTITEGRFSRVVLEYHRTGGCFGCGHPAVDFTPSEDWAMTFSAMVQLQNSLEIKRQARDN